MERIQTETENWTGKKKGVGLGCSRNCVKGSVAERCWFHPDAIGSAGDEVRGGGAGDEASGGRLV
eukprot:13801570-Ditylum_brightwellii.AAC.1